MHAELAAVLVSHYNVTRANRVIAVVTRKKDPRVDETEKQFYSAVGATDFAQRYYALCCKYPLRDQSPCKLPTKQVRRVLVASGCDPSAWNSTSRAYEQVQTSGARTLSNGFRVHGRTTVEFDFCVEGLSDDRVGGSFAAVARHATLCKGGPVPDPPYPRPEFHSTEELEIIITECMALGDLLSRTAADIGTG